MEWSTLVDIIITKNLDRDYRNRYALGYIFRADQLESLTMCIPPDSRTHAW
jgi:hypothetical protein